MTFLADWAWSALAWVVKAAMALVLIVVTALFWAEAVSRAYRLASWGVEIQVRRLPEVERLDRASGWHRALGELKGEALPIGALCHAFVRVPHECRRLLRTEAKGARQATGIWSPWTRTGRLIFSLATRLLDWVERGNAEASLIAYDGRIMWSGLASFEEHFPGLNLDEVARYPRVARATLLTEADALLAELRDPIESTELGRREQEYGEIVARLRASRWRAPRPMPDEAGVRDKTKAKLDELHEFSKRRHLATLEKYAPHLLPAESTSQTARQKSPAD